MTPYLYYLGLGSNLGDREAMLRRALSLLDDTEAIWVLDASSIYETAPWGETDQPPFLNLVARARAELTPHGLLAEAKRIEAELGRRPRCRWGPREIDIDLLLCDDLTVETPDLTIPHSALAVRPFVLAPLAELAPDLRLPGGQPVSELAQGAADVRLWRARPVWEPQGARRG